MILSRKLGEENCYIQETLNSKSNQKGFCSIWSWLESLKYLTLMRKILGMDIPQFNLQQFVIKLPINQLGKSWNYTHHWRKFIWATRKFGILLLIPPKSLVLKQEKQEISIFISAMVLTKQTTHSKELHHTWNCIILNSFSTIFWLEKISPIWNIWNIAKQKVHKNIVQENTNYLSRLLTVYFFGLSHITYYIL